MVLHGKQNIDCANVSVCCPASGYRSEVRSSCVDANHFRNDAEDDKRKRSLVSLGRSDSLHKHYPEDQSIQRVKLASAGHVLWRKGRSRVQEREGGQPGTLVGLRFGTPTRCLEAAYNET